MADLLIVPIRGSFDLAPMNISTVYFSKNNFANHAAINVFWNIGRSLSHISQETDQICYMKPEQARQIFTQLYPRTDSSEIGLNSSRPNIVVLVLEGFTTNAIEAYGGEKGFTPNFTKQSAEGILLQIFTPTAIVQINDWFVSLADTPFNLALQLSNIHVKSDICQCYFQISNVWVTKPVFIMAVISTM